MILKRADYLIAQELDQLIDKSIPYGLSIGTSTIHDFVKGLVLSTNIIDVIRKHLPARAHINADWGQVIGADGNTFSKECDIVIYRNTPFKEIENKSMRFTLVEKKQVNLVIQVRSSIQSVTKDDRGYCQELRKFAPKVWYIAECCWAKSINRANTICRQLKNAGYEQFFYLYRRDDQTLGRTIEYEPFIRFIRLIKRLR